MFFAGSSSKGLLLSKNPRYAAATLVSHPSYVVGALVLGLSLERVGWNHETLAIITSEIGEEDQRRLSRYWTSVRVVDPIGNPSPPDKMGFSTYETVYTKLHLWNQTEFDRLIYLDADTIVVGSLDQLLEGPDFAASPCFTAPDLFNAGMMVLKPSRERYEDLMEKRATLPSYDGSDQGFLNSYFPDWYTGDPSRRLPMKFNVPRLLRVYRPAWNRLTEDMRVLHYVGRNKPWKINTQDMEKKKRKPSLWAKLRRRNEPREKTQAQDETAQMWLRLHQELEV